MASALRADADSKVRDAAVETLGSMGEAGHVYVADVSAALRDSCRYVRLAAADVLREIGASSGPEAAATLAGAIATDDSAGMPLASTKALGALGEHAYAHAHVLGAVLMKMQDDTTTALRKEGAAQVRKTAADALGEMGDVGASQRIVLARALRTDPCEVVRYCAAWALGTLGKHAQDQAAAVVEALEDADTDVRCAALRALGLMGPTGV